MVSASERLDLSRYDFLTHGEQREVLEIMEKWKFWEYFP